MPEDLPGDGPAPSLGDDATVVTIQDALGPDFEIVRRLGRGSMASVYLAREVALNRFVAVKVLLPGKAADETARRRFEREARAAASLSHPNVVQVFRFGRLPDETPYLVMRYVKGRTMEERLKAEGPLPVPLARQVLTETASALAAAHAQGIVHRDVRPANVLWDEDSRAALLTDFGIAALLSTGGHEATRLTRTGQMVGDPRYLSPEQLKDLDLTELADMYSFGVLGYELLTGSGPYDAKTNTQWITAHLQAEPKELTTMRPEVDGTLAGLLRNCLNREPNHRPSAANAARILRGEAVSGTGGGSVEDAADLGELIRRRVPQIVVISAAAAWLFLQVIDTFIQNDSLPDIAWNLSLPFATAGVAAATVVAWFHGERGRQQTNVLEWVLLSVIGVLWLTTTGWILLNGAG